jgi:DNA topoisomerase I
MAFPAGERHSSALKTRRSVRQVARGAQRSGLHYLSDSVPGLRRKKAGSGYVYMRARGLVVRDPAVIARIKSLAIPPAYTEVWISPDPRGHVQATARDSKGRKQYRYHPLWRAKQDAFKYDRMLAFGTALPRIRARLRADLCAGGVPRKKVLATAVRLLESTLIRVGNKEYARSNNSYGLTTLRNRHVHVNGSHIHFRFRGKSGVPHDIQLNDPRLARTLRRCLGIPGKELFHYLDEKGRPRPVQSGDINVYIQEISGRDFSAKDYRTWVGSVLALAELSCRPYHTQREARRNIAQSRSAWVTRQPSAAKATSIPPCSKPIWLAG